MLREAAEALSPAGGVDEFALSGGTAAVAERIDMPGDSRKEADSLEEMGVYLADGDVAGETFGVPPVSNLGGCECAAIVVCA
jgi:hypothetical protein